LPKGQETGFDTLFTAYDQQFMGLHRIVLSLTLAAMITMLTVSFLLGAELGPVGVAIGYMMAVMLLFVGLRLVAKFHFRRLGG
jgi:hypothetical protein